VSTYGLVAFPLPSRRSFILQAFAPQHAYLPCLQRGLGAPHLCTAPAASRAGGGGG
jgi:hypothetical protein